jgi:hypothetical protein
MASIQSTEKAYISSNNIERVVRKAIIKESGKNSRILYAGPNPSNPSTMVVCKVVELFRGKYFYEETVFNPSIKSVHVTLSSSNEKFDEIIDPKQKLYEMRYKPQTNYVAATSYSRLLQGNKAFHNVIINDHRNQTWMGYLLNPLYYWRIRSYLNKKN